MAVDKFRKASRAKLNFTERYSLPPSDIIISVDPALTPLQLRVNQLVLPDAIADNAQVLVDAYRSSTGHYERLSFGDAGAFKSGFGIGAARHLRRIQSAEGLRFRVKIVEGAEGRLVAEADGLKSIEESGERAVGDLLPVIPKTLKGELWRLVFSIDGPEIWVEKSLDNAGIFLWTLAAFQALTLPMILRQIAERIIRNRDAEEHWYQRWTVLIAKHAPSFGEAFDADDEPDDQLVDEVLDEIASAFAREFKLLNIGVSALREGVEE